MGGACLRYGDIIIECPALKEYFTPIEDNGCGYSIDPRVRFLKSSGYKKPVPMSLVTSVMKVKVIPYDQILKAYEEAIKNPNIEVFINITKLVGYNDYSEYKMFIRDKTTGEEKLIQESIIDFTGRFNDILKKMYTLVTFNNPGLEGQSSEKVSWKSSEADRRIEFSGIDAYVLQELKEQFDQDKNSLDAEQISRHY